MRYDGFDLANTESRCLFRDMRQRVIRVSKRKHNTIILDCAASSLPTLATAAQIAAPLQVTSRTVTTWATEGRIPVALRCGKILRFYPASVAAALGIDVSVFISAVATDATKPSEDQPAR
jgi:hypothetical protein